MSVAASGYSGTPLAKKLGIKPGNRLFVFCAPKDYRKLLGPLPIDVSFENKPGPTVALAHIFVSEKDQLSNLLGSLRRQLSSDAILWVSWPKKAAKIATTVGEDAIRAVALPLGFVDVKVCAVDDVWSGLKLVVRKALR